MHTDLFVCYICKKKFIECIYNSICSLYVMCIMLDYTINILFLLNTYMNLRNMNV